MHARRCFLEMLQSNLVRGSNIYKAENGFVSLWSIKHHAMSGDTAFFISSTDLSELHAPAALPPGKESMPFEPYIYILL
jgi:hypothetical protein